MNKEQAKAQVRDHRLNRASREWLVDRVEALEAENTRLRAVVKAADELYAEVEMAESVGTCLPDRVPSLRYAEARRTLDAQEKR